VNHTLPEGFPSGSKINDPSFVPSKAKLCNQQKRAQKPSGTTMNDIMKPLFLLRVNQSFINRTFKCYVFTMAFSISLKLIYKKERYSYLTIDGFI
jgi:hypothetical protein